MKNKSVLEQLSVEDIEAITKKAAKKKDVPLVATKQVNMRLSPETMVRAKHLAKIEGKAVTSFLSALLKEDIERLWRVTGKHSKKSA
jgi:predicted DNA binding CopG/RHH family protein